MGQRAGSMGAGGEGGREQVGLCKPLTGTWQTSEMCMAYDGDSGLLLHERRPPGHSV